MSKAKYYRVIKPLTIGGREVLQEGMFIKVQEQKDGTYLLVNHPMGYGGFSNKEGLKEYTKRIKKKELKQIHKTQLEILQEEIDSLLDDLTEIESTLEEYESEYDSIAYDENFLDKYLYL